MRTSAIFLLVMAACGKENGSAAATEPAAAAAQDKPAASKHKLPGTLPDHFDETAVKGGLAALDGPAAPVPVEEIPNLRVPAGAQRTVTPLDDVVFVTYVYDKLPRDQGAVAYLTLLDEDGWKVTEWKRTETGSVMFKARHDNREFQLLAGAPKGQETTSSTLGAVVPKHPQLGAPVEAVRVKATWSRDKKLWPAKLLRTYGKLGFVRFLDNEGSTGWALLEKMDPPQPAGPPPVETCGVAAGDLVKSQFSLRRDRTWPAHVNEVYGAVALVDFDDDHALHWVECDRMWKR